jgi:hypothetical protein
MSLFPSTVDVTEDRIQYSAGTVLIIQRGANKGLMCTGCSVVRVRVRSGAMRVRAMVRVRRQ